MPAAATQEHDDSLEDFLRVRQRLLRIAGRIVGVHADAEDVVQDCWLRWNAVDRSTVRNAPAYLSRTATHLSISLATTAHARHQSTAGLSLVPDEPAGGDPQLLVENTEHLRAALGLLAARLEPRELVAYVVREAFALPYRQIGDLLTLTEANARQLVRRARVRLTGAPRRPLHSLDRAALLAAFAAVSRTGDPATLAALLHH